MMGFLELENPLRVTEKCPRTGDILSRPIPPVSALFRPILCRRLGSRLARRAAFCSELTGRDQHVVRTLQSAREPRSSGGDFPKIRGLVPHDQPTGHLVGFARILPANNADWAVFAGSAGS
jgi:hypothetical protein